MVDGLVVGDRDEPGPHIAPRLEGRVGAHGGEERLRPGIVRVDAGEQGAADPQHHRPVLGDNLLERLHRDIMSRHIMSRHDM